MIGLTLKQKIIAAVIAIGIALIALFGVGLGGKSKPTLPDEPLAGQGQGSASNAAGARVKGQDGEITLVSTNPVELKEKKNIIVLPDQTIEFTFSHPLENAPETKITIEPTADVKVELSNENKTVKIIPNKPYSLGQGFTLFFKGSTKFKGGKQLGSDMDFHFTTIAYNGV